MSSPLRRPFDHPEVWSVIFQLAGAIALTWPLLPRFFTHLGGDAGDPLQTLWSWRWLHDALMAFRNPFFTDRLYFPHGASLIYQTFDLPTAMLTLPLWGVFTPVAVYNAGVLFGFFITGYGMYRLVKELSQAQVGSVAQTSPHGHLVSPGPLTGEWLVANCAGLIFSATPYHLAHAQGHQQLLPMGWLPLYLVYLHRMFRGRASLRDAIFGGVFLALASLASWYHLLYAVCFTPILLAYAGVARRRAVLSLGFFRQAATLAVTFLAVAGPLLWAILRSRSGDAIEGAHDPLFLSGDVEMFFFPNEVQHWAHHYGERFKQWTGNRAENALYAGYSLIALAGIGALKIGGWARAYSAVGLLGAFLALGPHLHVGGTTFTGIRLPYAYLEKILPQIQFMGVPVRFGYVMYLGLCVSAALFLCRVREVLSQRGRTVVGGVLPILVTAMIIVEYGPRNQITTKLVVPAPMESWAEDPELFSVLDVSDPYRMMWHGTLHRKPMLSGYLTRYPRRLQEWYDHLPIVRGLTYPSRTPLPLFSRIDARPNAWWGGESPDVRLGTDFFQIEWTGLLRVPKETEWTFHLASDDGARLWLDDSLVVDNGGSHPMQWKSGSILLKAGPHPFRLGYEELKGEAGIRLDWQAPGSQGVEVPPEVFSTLDGSPGLVGKYTKLAARCNLDRAQTLRDFRYLRLRYVVTAMGDEGFCLVDELGLDLIYGGEGIRIYRVPET